MENARIQIVEDEWLIAETLKDTLIALGYEVVGPANTKNEAIEMAESNLPDLVLMDIMLHGDKAGIDAASEIYNRFDIPIIFLTAYSDSVTLEEAKQATPFGYLTKPVRDVEVNTNIQVALYRHKISKELAKKDAELRKLGMVVQSSSDAIMAISPDGKIESWNNAAKTIYGYEADDIIGQTIYQIVDKVYEIDELIGRVMLGEGVNNVEVLQVAKDGRLVNTSMTLSPVKDVKNEKTVGISIISRDITRRVEMETELKRYHENLKQMVNDRTIQLQLANERLKEEMVDRMRAEEEKSELKSQMLANSKLATLGELTAGMLHEINQPITYISGTLQLVQLWLADEVDRETLDETLRESARQIRRIGKIADSVRSFSRPNGSDETSNISLKNVLHNAEILLSSQLEKHEIALDREMEKELPEVCGKAIELEQVFINIIQNAIDALKDRDIAEKQISVTMKHLPTEGQIELRFSDNGVGISEENQERIFESFFTTKKKSRGTGLGLSIVRRILLEHESTVACESEKDKGTTFTILMPIADRID